MYKLYTHTYAGIYKIYTFTSVIPGASSPVTVFHQSHTVIPVILPSSSFYTLSFPADVTKSSCVEHLQCPLIQTLTQESIQPKQIWPEDFAHISLHITSSKRVKVAQSGKSTQGKDISL